VLRRLAALRRPGDGSLAGGHTENCANEAKDTQTSQIGQDIAIQVCAFDDMATRSRAADGGRRIAGGAGSSRGATEIGPFSEGLRSPTGRVTDHRAPTDRSALLGDAGFWLTDCLHDPAGQAAVTRRRAGEYPRPTASPPGLTATGLHRMVCNASGPAGPPRWRDVASGPFRSCRKGAEHLDPIARDGTLDDRPYAHPRPQL
jgi:hypothetical protein